jgi:hypothetical protein
VEVNPNADICSRNVAVLGIGGETADSYVPAMEPRPEISIGCRWRSSSRILPLEEAERAVELAQRDEAMKVVLWPAVA